MLLTECIVAISIVTSSVDHAKDIVIVDRFDNVRMTLSVDRNKDQEDKIMHWFDDVVIRSCLDLKTK